MERLRLVAGADGTGPALLARESAAALVGLATEPREVVTACRRLVERHPTSGPMWWLAARVLSSGEPAGAAAAAAEALHGDRTTGVLTTGVPEAATVIVVGWPELVGQALRRRGDLRPLVVDAGGDGAALARHLRAQGSDHHLVPDAGVGSAVTSADLVLLEALAVGPDGFVATAGSRAAAAVARHAAVPVWLAAGVGRVLPPALWEALRRRLDGQEPWRAPEEIVPLELLDRVARPDGLCPPQVAAADADCPFVPELVPPVG